MPVDPEVDKVHSPARVSDLIGTRRPSRSRSLRTWGSLAGLCAASLMVAYVSYGRVSSYVHPETSEPAGRLLMDATSPEKGLHLGAASLRYLGTLAILSTRGSPSDIGWQQGRLLGQPIAMVQRSLAPNISSTVSERGFWGKRFRTSRLRWLWRTLDDGIPGHQLVEMAAMVRGAAASRIALNYESTVRQSAVLDVGTAAPASPGADMWMVGRALTLLVPLTSERGDRLVVARTLSMPGVLDGGQAIRDNQTLQIVHPENALAYASLGYAGLVGVQSGVNSASIGVFLHSIKTDDVRLSREAQPSQLLAKEVLESAQSLDEAVSIIGKATVLGSALFVIVDGRSRKWAIVERSPTVIEVRRGTGSSALVDTFEGSKFQDDALLDRSRRARPMLLRQKRAQQLLRGSHATVSDIAKVLRDRQSSTGARLALGHRAALDDPQSTQTAIFDLSSMVLWVSESGDSSGAFRAIDLAFELASKTGTPAPPADINASEEPQSPRSATRASRRLLVLARVARNLGNIARARELAATALVQSLTLSEALLLAGELAKDDDDELAGRALLQRFLELGGDDLRATEQAHAWLGL